MTATIRISPSLMALLDPSLVDGAGELVGTAYRRHVVRRLKSHIRSASGAPMFRERIVIPVRVDVTDAAPCGTFIRRCRPWWRRGCSDPAAATGLTDALAFVSLLKRSMSTIAACLATLRVVAERYGTKPLRERQRALRAYRRRMARFGVLGPAEEAEIAELEAEEMAASCLARHRGGSACADPPGRGRGASRSETGGPGAGDPTDPAAPSECQCDSSIRNTPTASVRRSKRWPASAARS